MVDSEPSQEDYKPGRLRRRAYLGAAVALCAVTTAFAGTPENGEYVRTGFYNRVGEPNEMLVSGLAEVESADNDVVVSAMASIVQDAANSVIFATSGSKVLRSDDSFVGGVAGSNVEHGTATQVGLFNFGDRGHSLGAYNEAYVEGPGCIEQLGLVNRAFVPNPDGGGQKFISLGYQKVCREHE